jgi:hypothetical protein
MMPLQTANTQTSAEHSTSRACNTFEKHAVCTAKCLHITYFETATAAAFIVVQWQSGLACFTQKPYKDAGKRLKSWTLKYQWVVLDSQIPRSGHGLYSVVAISLDPCPDTKLLCSALDERSRRQGVVHQHQHHHQRHQPPGTSKDIPSPAPSQAPSPSGTLKSSSCGVMPGIAKRQPTSSALAWNTSRVCIPRGAVSRYANAGDRTWGLAWLSPGFGWRGAAPRSASRPARVGTKRGRAWQEGWWEECGLVVSVLSAGAGRIREGRALLLGVLASELHAS